MASPRSRLSKISERRLSLSERSEPVAKPEQVELSAAADEAPEPAPAMDGAGADALPRGQRWQFAAATMGIWGPLTVFTTHRTTLFVIFYQADVSMLAAVGIVMGILDALNGPFLARWADAGLINRLRCFPSATWGRRAPLLLLGAPIMCLGPTIMWLAPSRDRGVLVAWYALCYFCMVNGTTVTLQSYLASIQELFPTGGERALAVVRQTPFLVLTYIVGGALPVVLAFSTTPDTEGRCCVTPRYDCSVEPPCGCYNESARPAALARPSQLFHPTYAAVCGNGTLAPTASAAEMERQREAVCSEPGIPYARFAAVAAMTLAMGVTAWLAVSPARRSRVTPRASDDLLRAIKLTFAQRAFLAYTSHMFLSLSWVSFLLANLPIYLVYVIKIEPAEIAANFVVRGAAPPAARARARSTRRAFGAPCRGPTDAAAAPPRALGAGARGRGARRTHRHAAALHQAAAELPQARPPRAAALRPQGRRGPRRARHLRRAQVARRRAAARARRDRLDPRRAAEPAGHVLAHAHRMGHR